jgi:hypothetical protein
MFLGKPGIYLPAPMDPKPPAADTAAANSGVATSAIGAEMMGDVISESHQHLHMHVLNVLTEPRRELSFDLNHSDQGNVWGEERNLGRSRA